MQEPVRLPRLYYDPETGLIAPASYLTNPIAVREAICNGAGPKGWGWSIPDSFLGRCVTQAANIHDWMYHFSRTEFEKFIADIVFLVNMVLLVLKGVRIRQRRRIPFLRSPIRTGPVTWWRLKQCLVYFLFVFHHGGGCWGSGQRERSSDDSSGDRLDEVSV